MNKNKEYLPQCTKCHIKKRICKQPDGEGPKFCATKLYSEAIQEAKNELKKKDIRNFAKMASIQEAECYIHREKQVDYNLPTKPRIQEIIEFSKKMNYKRLGIAFCGGLSKEAEILTKILENNHFEVVSVICKVGGIEKDYLGLDDTQKIKFGRQYEAMCNPIAQAKVMNEAKTDYNIIMGLCVGHDSLFIKYSEAMVTIFAAKDRLFGHNPLAAIYTSHSYCRRFLSPDYIIED